MSEVAKNVPTYVKNIIKSLRSEQKRISNLKNGDTVAKEDDVECEFYSCTLILSSINQCRKK